MDEATKLEVMAMIAGAVGPVTEQMGSLAEAVKPVSGFNAQLAELQKNLGIVSDTIKNAPPVNPESIKKLVGDTLTEQTQAAAVSAARSQSQAKLKSDWLAANAPKLPPTYQGLIPDTDDAAALETAGKAALARYEAEFKASGPAVASAAAASAGGNAPAAGVAKAAALSGVSAGVAKFAESIVLPGASTGASTSAAAPAVVAAK